MIKDLIHDQTFQQIEKMVKGTTTALAKVRVYLEKEITYSAGGLLAEDRRDNWLSVAMAVKPLRDHLTALVDTIEQATIHEPLKRPLAVCVQFHDGEECILAEQQTIARGILEIVSNHGLPTAVVGGRDSISVEWELPDYYRLLTISIPSNIIAGRNVASVGIASILDMLADPSSSYGN